MVLIANLPWGSAFRTEISGFSARRRNPIRWGALLSNCEKTLLSSQLQSVLLTTRWVRRQPQAPPFELRRRGVGDFHDARASAFEAGHSNF